MMPQLTKYRLGRIAAIASLMGVCSALIFLTLSATAPTGQFDCANACPCDGVDQSFNLVAELSDTATSQRRLTDDSQPSPCPDPQCPDICPECSCCIGVFSGIIPPRERAPKLPSTIKEFIASIDPMPGINRTVYRPPRAHS